MLTHQNKAQNNRGTFWCGEGLSRETSKQTPSNLLRNPCLTDLQTKIHLETPQKKNKNHQMTNNNIGNIDNIGKIDNNTVQNFIHSTVPWNWYIF